MKNHNIHLSIALVCLFVSQTYFQLYSQAGQCLGGGCTMTGTSYGAAQSTTSSTFVNSVAITYAGEYNTYNVTAGMQYEWSLCSADGATNPTSDAQLTLKNTSNGIICYSDDYCGASPKILWTATFTGQVRVLINQYNCATNSNSHTVRWRCVTCSNPCTSIPTIMGCATTVTASMSGSGTGWNITNCGYNTPGQERIFQFTAPITGTYQLNVSAISGGYIDFFWKPASDGCNNTGWNCIDDILSTGLYNATTPMNFIAGTTYYILLDPEATGAYSVSFNLVCPCTTIPAVPTLSALSNTFCIPNYAQLTASGMAPGGRVINFTSATETNSVMYSGVANTFTMELWVNPTSQIEVLSETNLSGIYFGTNGNQRYAVYPVHGGATNAGAGISVGTNGVAVFEHGDAYIPSILFWQGSITGWTHIAVVYNAKTPSLYVNGQLVRTGLTSTRANVYPSAGVGTGGYGKYQGAIDNYRIWNSARTQGQIQANMHYRTPASVVGLLGHYTFDNNNTNATVGTNLTNSGGTFSNANYYTYTWSGGPALPAPSLNEQQSTGNITSAGSYNYYVTATAGACPGTLAGPLAINVVQPSASGMSTGDYVWGGTQPFYTSAAEWFVYNGTGFSVASNAPTANDNVFIDPIGVCATIHPHLWSSDIYAKDLTIRPGANLELGPGPGGSLNMYGSFYNNSGNAANIINSGTPTVVFHPGPSPTRQIGGNTPSTFVALSNNIGGGYLDINQPITVINTLNMNSSFWLNNRLILGVSPSITGTLNHSFPAGGWMAGPGYFRRYFAASTNTAAAGNFPLGALPSVYWRQAIIQFTTAPSSGGWIEGRFVETPLSYYNGLPIMNDAGVDIQNFMNEGYWELNPGGGLAGGLYTLTLQRDGIGTVTDPSLLRILKSPDPHISWVVDGAHGVVTGGLTAGTISRTGMSGFSYFVISSDNTNPLPVQLLTFNAQCKDGSVHLNWATATEVNNDYFVVEKSNNGNTWTEVEVQPGGGNSNVIRYYESIDSKPFSGLSYYRLRQVDYNGDQETFGPLSVTCININNTDYALIYPNPTNGEFTVELNAGNAYGNGVIEIMDMLGRKVVVREINIQEGSNIITFMDEQLRAGTYHISIQLNGVSLPVQKLVIK